MLQNFWSSIITNSKGNGVNVLFPPATSGTYMVGNPCMQSLSVSSRIYKIFPADIELSYLCF